MRTFHKQSKHASNSTQSGTHNYRFLQPKLKINKPGDKYEREADRVADEVMKTDSGYAGLSGHENSLQRKCACGGTAGATGECEQCQKKRLGLQRKAENHTESLIAPPIVHEVLRSPGQPLDPALRAFMEARFGHDFGQVKVHTDAKAAEAALAVNALAYSVGQNVVFGSGQYAPATSAGRQLLTHELAHTIQQGKQSGRGEATIKMGYPSDRYEIDANNAASAVAHGEMATIATRVSGPVLSRNGGRIMAGMGGDPSVSGVQSAPTKQNDVTELPSIFMAPAIIIGERCPTDPSQLQSIIDQIWNHTQEGLVPIRNKLRQLAGQAGASREAGGFLSEMARTTSKFALRALDIAMSLGQGSASRVADTLQADIVRIEDFLKLANIEVKRPDPKTARRHIDWAYGLLVRNMYWLHKRTERPSAEDFDLFGDRCE